MNGPRRRASDGDTSLMGLIRTAIAQRIAMGIAMGFGAVVVWGAQRVLTIDKLNAQVVTTDSLRKAIAHADTLIVDLQVDFRTILKLTCLAHTPAEQALAGAGCPAELFKGALDYHGQLTGKVEVGP